MLVRSQRAGRSPAATWVPVAGAVLCAVALLCACEKNLKGKAPHYTISAIGLEIPKLSGWEKEQLPPLTDLAAGGTIFTLKRPGGVPMSPRIDVVVAPRTSRPTDLDTHLARTQRDMNKMQSNGKIRIVKTDTEEFSVGPRRGFRLSYEFVVDSTDVKVSFTQLFSLLVLNGQGVTVTAIGRTELFEPLRDSINRILTGIATPLERSEPIEVTPVEAPE